jgi:hypothetical protein
MLAYKSYATIKDPARLELTGLPFRPGQRVEVLVIAEDEERSERGEKLSELLKMTQALPQAQAISEEMIAEEIAEYRFRR